MRRIEDAARYRRIQKLINDRLQEWSREPAGAGQEPAGTSKKPAKTDTSNLLACWIGRRLGVFPGEDRKT